MGVYSHSKLDTFRRCPRRFFYRYVAKVPLEDEPEFIATFLGSRVHEALEFLYEGVQLGKAPTEAEVLKAFRALWKREWTESVVLPENTGTAGDFQAIGKRCLSDYYARYTPFDKSRVIGLERQILFHIDAKKKHLIRGYIDRLARKADGTWQIHDYKTNAHLPTQADKDADPQLAYYELGIRQMWPDVENVELIWHFLRFDQSIVSTRRSEQLEELKHQTLETISDIESRSPCEEVFPTHESGLCNYCEYQAICPVRKHLFEVRQLPPNKFVKQSSVKLVNQWTELKAQQDELARQQDALQAEIEEIKDALLQIAERKGFERIVGSDKEVVIAHDQKSVFPRKGLEPEEAERLEAALRKSSWWSEVSSLDRNCLARLWEDPSKLDPKLRKLLKKYASAEESVQVRLRNRRG